MYCTDYYWLNKLYAVFIPFCMHFADVPPDKPQAKADCCDFYVYYVVIQIKIVARVDSSCTFHQFRLLSL